MTKRISISIVLLLVTLVWSTYGLGEQPPAPRGELRIVDNSHRNFAHIVFNAFEHLIELDKDGKLVPRLSTSWRWLNNRTVEFKLRRGVTYPNGEVFDAEIVKLNWKEIFRYHQPHSPGVFLNFKPGSRMEVLDPYTVRFIFPESDGGAMTKILLMHMGNRQFYRDLGGWGEKGF